MEERGREKERERERRRAPEIEIGRMTERDEVGGLMLFIYGILNVIRFIDQKY